MRGWDNPLPCLPSQYLSTLSDVCPGERDALLLEKLDRCGVLFDFQNTLSDKESKDMKRSDLMDILCYLSSNRNIVPADVCGGVISMVMIIMCPQHREASV